MQQNRKWKTREVLVGNIGVGGDNPVRIQSMTTSDTRDVEATISQIMKLADHGCEIARVTVQGMKEADACEEIKNGLIQKGYTIPVVADIHFYPPAAMRVVDSVDKVRVNPGNFVDKRASFKVIEYDEQTYHAELEKIEEKFGPLVEKCKKLKRAMRIGTNHGSLSDRIMNWYGDSPKGMVESAIEFATVCRKLDYHDIIFSMKASNTVVMIAAYRLLVERMQQMGWDYPLHLGVTEAGEGEDGRVKSAIGIGSLLLDGIGDTIRVSLTEDPWFEIDPCKRLIAFQKSTEHQRAEESLPWPKKAFTRSPLPQGSFLHPDGSVISSLSPYEVKDAFLALNLGLTKQLGRYQRAIDSSDGVCIDDGVAPNELLEISDMPFYPLKSLEAAQKGEAILITDDKGWDKVASLEPSVIFFSPKENRVQSTRSLALFLENAKIQAPLILNFHYFCSQEDLVIAAASEMGSLLTDGIGQGIALGGNYPTELKRRLSFNILQGSRLRNVKTEFISCPGCGRTLFNLQKTAERIRLRTGHLPGVKIAIMGCIVNGPGEMADADFGYVGSRPGKIDLYVGKRVVEKNIDTEVAEDKLIELIKAHNRWVEPPVTPPVVCV